MNSDLQITYIVEGKDEELGHVRLEHLISQLALLRRSLEQVDRNFNHTAKPTTYYRIVAANHSSPLALTLEPVIAEGRDPETAQRVVQNNHDNYFREINRLSRGEPPSPEVDDTTLSVLSALLNESSRHAKSARIHNHSVDVALDDELRRNVSRMLRPALRSVGTVRGRLEKVNLHRGANRFWIYPISGPSRIECKFSNASDRRTVKENLDRIVEVYGQQIFRPNSDFPHLIKVMHVQPFVETARSMREILSDIRREATTAPTLVEADDEDEW